VIFTPHFNEFDLIDLTVIFTPQLTISLMNFLLDCAEIFELEGLVQKFEFRPLIFLDFPGIHEPISMNLKAPIKKKV
jgi:hypothetical protein